LFLYIVVFFIVSYVFLVTLDTFVKCFCSYVVGAFMHTLRVFSNTGGVFVRTQ
jgi:hypothetical protein